MDIEKLIERLRSYTYWLGQDGPESHDIHPIICDDAATALSTLQDENESLRVLSELGNMRAKDYRVMRDRAVKAEAENEKLRAELEQVKAKRDAAIEYLREIEWCAGCKHFGGPDGCKKWVMGQCAEKHDLYEFVGPEKED